MILNWEKHGITIPGKYRGKLSGNIKIPCPFCADTRHNPKDPSLSCNMEDGTYHCHHCNKSGCVAEKEESEYKAYKAPRKTYKKPERIGNATISDNAAGWFMKRGITLDTVFALKITEGQEYMPQDGKMYNTIQFNYFHDGEHVNTKYRTGDKKFKLVSGAELLLYNIDAIKGEKECIITEGEMDALSFYEVGFHNVVSVPNGANANLEYLDDYIEDYFEDKETIYIASDTDEKGLLLRGELLRRFGAERCKIVTYGEDCKDANELLMAKGAESLRESIKNAADVKIEGIIELGDVEANLDVMWQHGLQKGMTLGFPNMDELISFETKRLAILTGIPGHGKSEFIDQIAERLNMRYGWKWAFFSPENMPVELHISKYIEKFTGKKFSADTLGTLEYNQAKQHIAENIFFISPPDNFTLDNILEKARFLVRRKGVKGVVIDPYNEVEHQIPNGMSETQYISTLLGKLKNFALRNDVMIFLMAHPIKMKKTDAGVSEVPTLYDIAGSANFYNKADFGIVVYRNFEEQVTEIHVDKVKFKHLGEKGTCKFKYNINNGRYTPYDGLREPEWDNENHLLELKKSKERQADMEDFWNVATTGDCPY